MILVFACFHRKIGNHAPTQLVVQRVPESYVGAYLDYTCTHNGTKWWTSSVLCPTLPIRLPHETLLLWPHNRIASKSQSPIQSAHYLTSKCRASHWALAYPQISGLSIVLHTLCKMDVFPKYIHSAESVTQQAAQVGVPVVNGMVANPCVLVPSGTRTRSNDNLYIHPDHLIHSMFPLTVVFASLVLADRKRPLRNKGASMAIQQKGGY